jgi:hypothetical protein
MLVVGGLVVFVVVSRGRGVPYELQFLPQNERIVNRLCPDGRSKPAWVFSDRPIYTFQAGLVVPPPLAVSSGKRLFSGELSEDMLLDTLRTYRPEYVVLERYYPRLGHRFTEALGGEYALLEESYERRSKMVAQLFGLRISDAGALPRDRGTAQRVIFNDWLTLVWTSGLLENQVQAGDCVAVRGLEWHRPASHPGQDLAISLRLTDTDGSILTQYDEALGSDFHTLRDRAQLLYFLNLLIPEGTPPGQYDLRLVVYDPQTGEPLQAVGEASMESGVLLKQVRVDRPAGAMMLRPALADFGSVRLISADTPATVVSPGGEVPLDLLWQADADHRGESLVVVAQLLDDQGRVVAGLEQEPLNGRHGTAVWQPGELVRDNHKLSVPADTPPGKYDLIIGLYRLPARERLKTRTGLLGLRPRDYFFLRKIEVR